MASILKPLGLGKSSPIFLILLLAKFHKQCGWHEDLLVLEPGTKIEW